MSEHIHRRAELFRQPDRRPVQPPDIPDDVYLVCLSDKCATANKPSANFQNTRSCIKRAHPITVSKSLCHPYLTASDGLLHPQNREMLRFLWFHLVEHPVAGALLHHAMALPRTHLVFAFAHAVLRAPRHESHRVLLVCPPSIFQEWQTASLSYADHLSIIIPDPQEWPADIDKWSSKGGLLVVSHTLYHHILDHQQSGERRKALEALIRPGPDIIILDDASRLNTVPCQPHRLTRFLNRTRTPARLALTSVPCAADLVRIWPVVDWACPQFLGSRSEYWNDFVKPIADGHRYGSHSGVGHASLARARLLYNKLTTISCSLSPDVRTEALIARDKRMIESTICVNLHSQQAAVYAKVEKTLAEALGHGRISPYVAAYLLTIAASETTALRRCLTAGADERYTDIAHRRLMGPLDRARDVFRRILEELGPPEEIPIFCSKMKVVIEMSQRAISDSERLVVFCGSAELQVEVFNNLRKRFSAEQVHDFDLDANESARMDSLDHFNENGAVFVAPYGPSLDCIEGAGWSFVNATRVLMLDSGWHYLSTVQAINRVFGYSQVCPVVHVYHVIAQGTIEQAFRKDMIDRHVEMLRLRSCGDGRISVSTFAELRNFLLVPEIPTIYFRTEPPELKAILASPAVIGKVPVITAHPEHTAKHEEYISQFRSMHMDSSQNNPLVHQIILDDNKHEIMSHSFTGAVASVSDLTAEEGETECIRKNKDTMLQDFNPVLLKLGGRQYDLHERLGGLRCDALAQDELFQEPPEIPCNLPAGWHEYSRLFESDAIPPLDKQLAPQKSVKRRNTPAIERSHEEPPRTRRRFLDDPDFE